MTVGLRLNKFIELTYCSQLHFAKICGIQPVALNRYIKGKILPGAEILIKFQIAGLSIDWLLTGKGKMIWDKSPLIHKMIENNNLFLPMARLKQWIMKNYLSIENYALLINYNVSTLINILDNDFIPEPDFINLVRMSGCNINWLSSGDGSEFETNYIGLILKARNEKPEMYSDKKGRIDMKKIKSLSSGEFYEIIKFAVTEQFNELIGN